MLKLLKNIQEINKMYSKQIIKDKLFSYSDKKYADFSSGLIPGAKPLIGVRIPVLRNLAKEIAKSDYINFLNTVDDEFFEEIMLKAFVIGYLNVDSDTLFSYIDDFIPQIDNWSVNDSLCTTLKIVKKFPDKTWDFLKKYFNSDKEYENRFANIMLMSHFLNDEYIDRVLMVYKDFNHSAYYAKMGVAWAVATAYAKYPEKTMDLLKKWKVDAETYNMSIRKMCESYRVSDEDKAILKTMKKNKNNS